VREEVQGETGPFYLATAHTTKLDDIATQTYQAHPDNIARLGYSIVHQINNEPKTVAEDDTIALVKTITEALLAAKKPLIVAGTSLYNAAIIEAAANISYALKAKGKDVGLLYVVPEANSIGLCMLADKFLDEAFEKTVNNGETLIVLENDLYQRMDKTETDKFLSQHKNIITLDYLDNATMQKSTYTLPAGTFAEADGTIINNEGRVQRFYQVHIPDNDVKSSWKWVDEMMTKDGAGSLRNFETVIDNLVEVFPALSAIQSIAPRADYRDDTQKIPREPQGYSGRTAMHADTNISELKPPLDPDSALSFTMEGYSGIPPSPIIPFYWSPGWNSVQAINKYQIEVGGPLHGGNPGERLFEPVENDNSEYFKNVPPSFIPKEGEWLVLPLYHIFGSDKPSALSPAVAERVPKPYISLNNNDALKAGIVEGILVEVLLNGNKHKLPVKLNTGLPAGIAGLPKGLKETEGLHFPFWIKLNKVENE